MRFIPTKIHGILDYLVAIILMSAPWLLGFGNDGAETWVPVILGAGTIVYSLFTDYEWGASRKISMRTHLNIDLVSGIFLAASPWIFGFSEYVYLPHVVLGIVEVGASLMSRAHAPNEKREHSNTKHQASATH